MYTRFILYETINIAIDLHDMSIALLSITKCVKLKKKKKCF